MCYFGFARLRFCVRELTGVSSQNCSVKNRWVCRCVQVVFPQKRENLKFHVVRVFLDRETGLPIRFAAYSWPLEPGGSPRLIEEYTFLNFQLNVGLSEVDFDRENPSYQFYSASENVDRQSNSPDE